MKKQLIATIAIVIMCSICQAHDKVKAEQYRKLYAKCNGKKVGKELFMMAPDMLLEKMKQKEDLLILDVRTNAEAKVIGITSSNVLHIPMNEVFEEKSLSKLPKDKQIIVFCRMGARSVLITMGLRDIGYKRVFNLKHGLKGLLDILTPKSANK